MLSNSIFQQTRTLDQMIISSKQNFHVFLQEVFHLQQLSCEDLTTLESRLTSCGSLSLVRLVLLAKIVKERELNEEETGKLRSSIFVLRSSIALFPKDKHIVIEPLSTDRNVALLFPLKFADLIINASRYAIK